MFSFCSAKIRGFCVLPDFDYKLMSLPGFCKDAHVEQHLLSYFAPRHSPLFDVPPLRPRPTAPRRTSSSRNPDAKSSITRTDVNQTKCDGGLLL